VDIADIQGESALLTLTTLGLIASRWVNDFATLKSQQLAPGN
jgi:hypothetical protein